MDAVLAKIAGDRAMVEKTAASHASAAPRAMYLYNAPEIKVGADNSYMDFWIKLAGGKNVASGAGSGSSFAVTREQVLGWDPEVLILGNFEPTTPADVYADPKWASLSAVKNKRVYKAPIGGFSWDPPSNEANLMWLWVNSVFFPDVDHELRERIRETYRTLYAYDVTDADIDRILINEAVTLPRTWTDAEANVVLGVRLPRVLLGMLVGGGLALGGAALQAAFRNPLVSPQILGVSSGASFGGVLAVMLGLGSTFLVGGAFLFGLVALGMVLLIGRSRSGGAILMIVLGGVVTSAFFSALVSFITYIADPYSTLPSIVFWLMGSLATADMAKVAVAAVPILLGAALILRWRINILSLGDDDAASLGVNPGQLRAVLLMMVALMTAGAVAVSGVIGWVGLVVPHIARLWVGPDHRISMPTTFVLGAAYLTIIDTLSRTVTSGEIPLGILTAIIGAPVFVLLLQNSRRQAFIDA